MLWSSDGPSTTWCRYGYHCLRADCWFLHPEGRRIDAAARTVPGQWTQHAGARQKNAQVVILRRSLGNLYVLLQLRSFAMPVMPGHLATVGGMRDAVDRDSSITAVREVFEECGLLDVGLVPQAPHNLRQHAQGSGARQPKHFSKFGEGKEVDWWVLLLDGPGTFEKSMDGERECEDISLALPRLPGAEAAECFGHAWVPAWRLHEIAGLPLMGGLLRRVSDAVAAVAHILP
ncbi:unnamed protein product [Symbiodinium necroappetens]|uniref:Nudix hydrolase domain-containing protein n=1 Tax=Symbiodinium necroappetens TaxID=1628268 RepID=A0A812VMS0_9DINO|nr:unnamed protein product [Symbiodinium microadriaticum]CAE7649755.1 unnamed protein product [Symbiodinium necroappetens]CAE7915195.1 unnamed protein product [Symbiodinium sp. KB8]